MPEEAPIPGERSELVLEAQVHKATGGAAEGDDLDLDPALAACVQLALAGPHLGARPEPATRPPLMVSAFGMQLHASAPLTGATHRRWTPALREGF